MTQFLTHALGLGVIVFALSSTLMPPTVAQAATLRCRDTLHGQACDGERGYEVRCRDTLHGRTCDDNRGNETTCRETLHGSDCDVRRRK